MGGRRRVVAGGRCYAPQAKLTISVSVARSRYSAAFEAQGVPSEPVILADDQRRDREKKQGKSKNRANRLAASSQADCNIAVLWEPPAILPSMYADFAHNTTLQSFSKKKFTFDHSLLVANQSLFSRYLEPVSCVAHHHDRESTWKHRWMQQSHMGDMTMPEDARFAESVSGKSQGMSHLELQRLKTSPNHGGNDNTPCSRPCFCWHLALPTPHVTPYTVALLYIFHMKIHFS